MSRLMVPALLCACVLSFAAPALAGDKAPAKADPTEQLIARLDQELLLKEGANLNEIPLVELIQDLTRRYQLTFVINETAFKAAGRPTFREEKPNITATQLRGMKLRNFLNTTLEGMGATYLVKNDTIEIVPAQHAAKVAKTTATQEEDGLARLDEPLVSAVFKEKPLNEAVAKVAEMYDLTVVLSPQAGDAWTGFVTARLLNVPAEKALDLLAVQADLRVVRRGNAFLITSKDHANELFGEGLERERQKLELKKLKDGPAKPPVPPAPAPAEKPAEKPQEK